ncbi:MAG: hypothetical protein JWM59_3162 [Verrucomicrobiales bacterium]|nr:hypothetical protein [Verrucomicrobiales bacterium]
MKSSRSLVLSVLGGLTLSGHAQTHTAFVVPEGQQGNQAFGGALGMEFNVVSAVTVSKLGCFDDLSDGLQLPI